ncbi:hypothetical protein [Paenibacillus alvei]|uniref:hypothetical protein n=1 Tax=Paenibacillus alvei TaxID=44250 RepID=UPI0018CF6AF2|nr:hypothetical protein [Paenibacillus alvei]MBG9736280.1 hypothetical protein [Paenibacillus alvei]MBG9736292.1 hypothetical protein [Paenibacillus alvei]MBG9736304.1 hypothetical protein [Paenibacillus alvei]MBG9745647.1 hypothetical protein [Paenibacillus alvei]MBG9747118.1 hypothetical protein [Paenibacillus alvei]
MEIGRRIYYDVASGEVIVDTGERSGDLVIKKTIEDDIKVYKSLSERNRDSFDYIELDYGQYAEDFATRLGYQVNVTTKKLEFTYPNPNQPEPEQPSRKPLTEEVDELKRDHATLVIQLAEKGVI